MEEIEAKYRLADAAALDALRDRLIALDATPAGMVVEQNVLFDRADGSLAGADRVLRLRWHDGGQSALLTYKGSAAREGALKRREEREVVVADGATLQSILEALGYRPSVRYAKRRESWHLADALVTLDTLDFGCYCEIEGSSDGIARAAALLGLAGDQGEPRGYPSLAAEHARTVAPTPAP